MANPYLDKISTGDCLEDSTEITKALAALDAIYAAEPFLGLFKAEVRCLADGWIAVHESAYHRPEIIRGRRWERTFGCAEDAIAALRALIEKWRGEIEAENAREAGL